MLQRVITVHGLWTEGRWQEDIAPVLYPHFEPNSVKYGSYRFLGPLDLIFEPWVLLPGLGLLVCASFVSWWREWLLLRTGVTLGVLLLIVLVAAHLVVPIRLENTKRKFLADTAPSILSGQANNIIAHSLGSYLVATALRDDPPTSARNVVLAGCVLDRGFPWTTELSSKFRAIRNEVAGRDLVPLAAWLLRWRFRDLGLAGRKGFLGPSVHTIPSPNQSCTDCSGATLSVTVHNVVSPKMGHSGVLKATYAKYYWLPFFWGIDPNKFREFLNACSEMIEVLQDPGSAESPSPTRQFDALADNFLKQRWDWAGGRTIAEYIAYEFGRTLDNRELKIILLNMCQAAANAEIALGDKVEQWRRDPAAREGFKSAEYDEAIKALKPQTAVARAYLAFANIPKKQ